MGKKCGLGQSNSTFPFPSKLRGTGFGIRLPLQSDESQAYPDLGSLDICSADMVESAELLS